MNIYLSARSVTFYPKEPRLFVLTEPSIMRDLERRMTRVQYASRSMVRLRTGTLFSTIRKQPGVNTRFPFVNVVAGGRGARYVMYEHDGTVPHIIRARRRKSLRFVWRGQVVFRRQVRHPGTTGTFFLTRALPLAAD